MGRLVSVSRVIAIIVLLLVVPRLTDPLAAASEPQASFRVRLDTGHPWRPPFALERVGRPITAIVEASAKPPHNAYSLAALRDGKEISRSPVEFPASPPYSVRLKVGGFPDELVLSAASAVEPRQVELARQTIQLPEIEADAVADPDAAVNPVDLGTVLVPSDWLVLGPGQSAQLDFAAVSRKRDLPRAQVKAYFETAPQRGVNAEISLAAGQRKQVHLTPPETPATGNRDVLCVALEAGGRVLWRKAIPVMLVRDPPRHPRFGATYELLRYDAPISLRDPRSGAYSSLSYDKAWDPELRDVVVWLPSGARFVFWRGSSYIPFWAGRHNTGACYEWAEIISQPEGAVDCVEPLMDKELRYGRVEIVESTPARVHVRWSYQSTDFNYKVWGDAAVEDYYFYPDGFGTRVLSLVSDPKNRYELSEFIILTPQGAYPFDVLPETPVDALFLDGRKRAFPFPSSAAAAQARFDQKQAGDGTPAIFRLRLNRKEELSAVYFNPNETRLPPIVFAPFFDKGEMVTPCYWGSHWPLARGNSTGRAIDARIQFTPCHNSVMSWAGSCPVPIRTAEQMTLDALGRSRPMISRQWAWLIGMTDASDLQLLNWARSFATPPSLELRGGRLDFAAYAPERRALRLIARDRDVEITFKPGPPCVNPVLEWTGAPSGGIRVWLDDHPINSSHFAWDGRTLWVDATIEKPARMRLAFGRDKAAGAR
jgi:hypothetical protein